MTKMKTERLRYPSGELTPKGHAAQVAKVLEQYYDHNDPETDVADLLSDVLHYCDALKLDFANQVERRARNNYSAEVHEARTDCPGCGRPIADCRCPLSKEN